jgi:hypothetical protein
MLRNTINTVIILTLLIYEIKIEKYTKLFTRAIKNLHFQQNIAIWLGQVCDGFKQYRRLPVDGSTLQKWVILVLVPLVVKYGKVKWDTYVPRVMKELRKK